tara:strand:+ start:4287 stop:4571 length:285 start_codon:yes stop_codon:yes gene_type:complete
MGKIINIKVDVTKLDKSKFYKGEKGTYANLTVAENMDGESQYGDTHYVFESQSKEEREAKTPKNFVGNGKEFVFNNGQVSAPVEESLVDDDLPF